MISILWFTNDLRVYDNLSVVRAANSKRPLLCLFNFDPSWLRPNRLNSISLGAARHKFLIESLINLDRQLNQLGQHLMVVSEQPDHLMQRLDREFAIESVYYSNQPGINEKRLWQRLQTNYPGIHFVGSHTNTLFAPENLPFDIENLPASFSKFRKVTEAQMIHKPLPAPDYLPPFVTTQIPWLKQLPLPKPADTNTNKLQFNSENNDQTHLHNFRGGQTAGHAHLDNYFATKAALTYKETRNQLEGKYSSTGFSPWLANGCLSPRTVIAKLKKFELNHGANESTYWIFFEMLWREYFQWYAHAHGPKLFQFKGITGKPARKCFYGERYQRWCHGNTPFPLVNALMNQLNATGYLSNRGRQIAASAFIHEMQLDWRYGAAYFEQQLIDYDVGSNWGNWQYIAGVGADPRGGRHFNLEKQQQQFDPNQVFIKRWGGETRDQTLDSVDAADWPIFPDDHV